MERNPTLIIKIYEVINWNKKEKKIFKSQRFDKTKISNTSNSDGKFILNFFFFKDTFEQFGILKLNLTYYCLYLCHNQLIVLLQLCKSIRNILFQKFLWEFIKIQGNQFNSFILDVLDEVKPGIGVGIKVKDGRILVNLFVAKLQLFD